MSMTDELLSTDDTETEVIKEPSTATGEPSESCVEDFETPKRSIITRLKGISIFGMLSSVAYLVLSLVALYAFKTQEYEIDITQDALSMFLLFLGCGIAPIGLIVSPLGIIANIIAKWFKTKLVSILNAFIFAFAGVLLACVVML